MDSQSKYHIKLPAFEGPFDLLLHLIKDKEINIYDIPIVEITGQYLEYVSIMKELNLDIAGEYLVIAATLTQIKSRMLLPKPDPPIEEDSGEDPREELMRQLIEYKKYKDSVPFFRDKEEIQQNVFSRIPESIKDEEQEILLDMSIFDLLGAFQSILKKIGGGKVYEVTLDEVSMTEKLNSIMDVLSRVKNLHFSDLFKGMVTKNELVATFLAMLELIRLKIVTVQQTKQFEPIIILKAVEDDSDGDGEGQSDS